MPDINDQQLLEGELRNESARQELAEKNMRDQEELLEREEEINAEMADYERQEIEYANRLAAAQYSRQSDPASQLFSGPSLFKYALILLLFAIPNDIIDALDFTGIGFLFSWLISLFLSVSTLFLMWFSDSEFKRVKNHLSQKTKNIQRAEKVLTKTATKIARYAPRNPLIKVVAGCVLELVPIVSILPWASISVYLAYMDEKKAYKQAKETAGEIQDISEPELEMV